MLAKKDINRSNLIQLLTQEEYLKVLFKKSTSYGPAQTIRTMICTLYADSIPSNYAKSISATLFQNNNLNILPVWDVIKGKWRSFSISNIISVEIIEKQKNKKKKD